MSQSDIIARLYATLAQYEDVSPEQGGHPTFEETVQRLSDTLRAVTPKEPESLTHRGANVFAALRRANADRQDAWCGDHKPDLAFRGLELAGEAGEVANAVKKLERERHGWPGSRVTVADVAAELGDVVICADLIATQLGLQLDRCVIDKFNQTSTDRGYAIYIGDYMPNVDYSKNKGSTVLDELSVQRAADALRSDPAMRSAVMSPPPPPKGHGPDTTHGPHLLVFINGDPRSGKDTTSELIVKALTRRGYLAKMRSSIEPVRSMLTDAGFDLSGKTEADRYLLSEVGDRTEEHSSFRADWCVKQFKTLVKDAEEHNRRAAMVLHTREPETIHKIAFLLRQVDIDITTLFVSGRGTPISSNKADSKVRNMVYDIEIANAGTLVELEAEVETFVRTIAQ